MDDETTWFQKYIPQEIKNHHPWCTCPACEEFRLLIHERLKDLIKDKDCDE